MYDLIIVGGGAAGLSAAVYAKRAMLNAAVIENEFSTGGQIIKTYEVDNYLGLPGINGYDLAEKFREHADKFDTEFIEAKVVNIVDFTSYKLLELENGDSVKAKAVIIASGASHKKLGIKGEEEFASRGVSYCAVCDGAFFKNKTAAVIGGGDSAIEDALFLSKGCQKVYLIHRRDSLRGSKILQSRLFEQDNIEILYNSVVKAINGDKKVENITIVTDDAERDVKVDGVFVAIGIAPQSEAFKNILALDENGYIVAGETGRTNIEGIFAAGDVRTKPLRQIITAVADGANCVYAAEKYLSSL